MTGSGDEPVARDDGCGAPLPVAGVSGSKAAGASRLVTDAREPGGVSGGADDAAAAGVVAGVEKPGSGVCAVDPGEGAEALGVAGADCFGIEEAEGGCRVGGGAEAAREKNCQPIQPAPNTPSRTTSSGSDDLGRRRWTGTYPSVASTASPWAVRAVFARAGVARPRRSESKS